jgi:hypothetical protein
MKLLTRLAQVTGGMLCGDGDWGSVLKYVSRVRLDKEVSMLVAEAV